VITLPDARTATSSVPSAHRRPMVRSAGAHDVQVDLVQLGSGREGGPRHAPRAPGIPRHQPVLEALGPRRPAAPTGRRAWRDDRPIAQLRQCRRGDLPASDHLVRLQQTEADVPVHGHVVHAEQVGDLVQRERASGLCRHGGRTLVLKTGTTRTERAAAVSVQPPPADRRSPPAGRHHTEWPQSRDPAVNRTLAGPQPCLDSQRSLA
jgi:hypothetical protein